MGNCHRGGGGGKERAREGVDVDVLGFISSRSRIEKGEATREDNALRNEYKREKWSICVICLSSY